MNKIKEGIADKFGSAIQFCSTFICGIIIGYRKKKVIRKFFFVNNLFIVLFEVGSLL